MYLTRFIYLNPLTERYDPIVSTLGNRAKEDSVLQFVKENHVTYLVITGLHRIFNTMYANNPAVADSFSTLLCDFIYRAKNQYCVTSVGAAGTSVDFFEDAAQYDSLRPTPPLLLDSLLKSAMAPDTSLNFVEYPNPATSPRFNLTELTKSYLRMLLPGGGPSFHGCPGGFDYLHLDYEFWNPDNHSTDYKWDSVFAPMLDQVNLIKQTFNLLNPNDTIGISVYCRLDRDADPQKDSVHALCIDGGSGQPRRADRLLPTYYFKLDSTLLVNNDPYDTLTPKKYMGLVGLEQEENLRQAPSFDSTDMHPLFSAEALVNGGTRDYFGPWLQSRPERNIFTAERDFYNAWQSHRFTSPQNAHRENDV